MRDKLVSPLEAACRIKRTVPHLFITDWDETITTKDTIRLVAEAAYKAKPGFQLPFEHFINVYGSAYNKYKSQFSKTYRERDTVEKEVLFQKGLHDVEMASINEMTKHKLFAGVTKDNFKEQASKVVLRPHFINFLRKCVSQEIPVVILSINWTKIIIEAVLAAHGFKESKFLKIVVNELEFRENVSTGNFDQRISVRTGIDKLSKLKEISEGFNYTCYIGDSSTDLLALLQCDLAIAMKDSSVISLLHKLNVPCKYLGETNDFLREEVYIAEWKEICSFLE